LSTVKKSPIQWFRDAAPYIHAHRGKTFVIFISGNSVEHANFTRLVQDISLLHSLSIKIVIVHGARAQIDAALKSEKIKPEIINGIRVTDDKVLKIVKQQVSDIRLKLEAALSIGLGNRQVSGFQPRAASGNFIKAKPLGVVGGVDFLNSGDVRTVDVDNIRALLEQNAIVLLSSLGFASSGEVFNLNAEDVATQTAIKLQADKLIILGARCKVLDYKKNVGFLTTQSAAKLIKTDKINENSKRNVRSAITACKKGIARVHILNSGVNGILLEELFTPNGVGTLITDEPYEKIRDANAEDIIDIYNLIKPLQEAGILVERNEDQILDDLDNFYVLEQDEKIIGVVALYIYPENIGEIACVAVHTDYQNQGYGDKLIKFIEMTAKVLKLDKLFVLSTQAAHWFMEHSYHKTKIADLPLAKQRLYNYARNSIPFVKNL